MSEALRQCPFCGGDPIGPEAPMMDTWIIRCRSCSSEGGWAKERGNAAKNWNMRQVDSQTERLGQAMAQLLDDMGADGLSVCPAAKAKARMALEPFIPFLSLCDEPLDYTLEAATKTWNECQ